MKNTKPVMVRMPPELYERLKEAADRTMITPSALARILIKQQLDMGNETAYQPRQEPAEDPPVEQSPRLSRQERRRIAREAAKERR